LRKPDRYTITLETPTADKLKPLWCELEQRADSSFFQSWTWVSTWLDVYQPDCQQVSIYCDDVLVGLGLLTIAVEWRHRWLRSRVLRLGQTGDPAQDQIWIEYNDLLLDRAHVDGASQAFMAFMLQQSSWDEFQFGACTEACQRRYQHEGCSSVERWSAPAYSVDLTAIRKDQRAYLETLSRNTRYQINRSERLYQEAGELEFTVLSAADAIAGYWERLSQLHQQRWGSQPVQSGFANASFVEFHQALIREAAKNAEVEFCALSLHGQVIGLLYNFLYRGCVYFYLSGLEFEADSRFKPGLVIHARAIQHYLDRGMDRYDFMGGEARYKQSLGHQHGTLQLVSLQRPKAMLRLEQLGRRLKARLQAQQERREHY